MSLGKKIYKNKPRTTKSYLFRKEKKKNLDSVLLKLDTKIC